MPPKQTRSNDAPRECKILWRCPKDKKTQTATFEIPAASKSIPLKEVVKQILKIYKCKNQDGGISYSSRNRGSSRPAITAAALAKYRVGKLSVPSITMS